ncbi:hypothetical protein Gocc_2677 [Gaiella occulta]|uniref:Uncharacterized protein n=2 Tax=Gaiella occulta TaxID=1002870 RepID=A0A7M2YTY0_9ACTN|nr:hypothetical protein Gocc_2677 [Gaiella occulta]
MNVYGASSLTDIELLDLGSSCCGTGRVFTFRVVLASGERASSSSFWFRNDESLTRAVAPVAARALAAQSLHHQRTTEVAFTGTQAVLAAHLESAWLFAVAAERGVPLRVLLGSRSRNKVKFYVSLLTADVIDDHAASAKISAGCSLVKISYGAKLTSSTPFAVDCHGTASYQEALDRYGRMSGLSWVEEPRDADEVGDPCVPIVTGEFVTDWERELDSPRTQSSTTRWRQLEPARCGVLQAHSAAKTLTRAGAPVLFHGHQPYVAAHLAAATSGVTYVEINAAWMLDRFRTAWCRGISLSAAIHDLCDALDRRGGGPAVDMGDGSAAEVVFTASKQ